MNMTVKKREREARWLRSDFYLNQSSHLLHIPYGFFFTRAFCVSPQSFFCRTFCFSPCFSIPQGDCSCISHFSADPIKLPYLQDQMKTVHLVQQIHCHQDYNPHCQYQVLHSSLRPILSVPYSSGCLHRECLKMPP